MPTGEIAYAYAKHGFNPTPNFCLISERDGSGYKSTKYSEFWSYLLFVVSSRTDEGKILHERAYIIYKFVEHPSNNLRVYVVTQFLPRFVYKFGE